MLNEKFIKSYELASLYVLEHSLLNCIYCITGENKKMEKSNINLLKKISVGHSLSCRLLKSHCDLK